MALRAHPFTISGQIELPDEADEVYGVVYTGFTAVAVYDGTDTTGNLLIAGGSTPQTIEFNEAVYAEKGIYVSVTGTGKGSILY